MTDGKVTVTADEAGIVVVQSKNNPEWAYVRLEQERVQINERNFITKKPISTLLHGTEEDLNSFGWKANQEISGKIIIVESLEPFTKNNPERDVKKAGDTGIICVVGDKPIYRKTLYKLNTKAEDTLIMHTNTEEIKAYNKTQDNSILEGGISKL